MSPNPLELLASRAPRPTQSGHSPASVNRRRNPTRPLYPGSVVALFRDRNCYGRELEPGKHAVLCPWAAEHSDRRPAEDSDTVIWETGAGQPEAFHCSHDHCHGRTLADVLDLWCPPPSAEELFRAARAAEPAERPSRLKELAQVVCNDPLQLESWANQVREAGLATKGAFMKEAEAARRQSRMDQQPGSSRSALELYTTSAGPYRVVNGAMCHEKDTREGPVLVPLCNFDARISGEEVRDNGAERRVLFSVSGSLQSGSPLPAVSVAADQFPSLGWITPSWGNRAVIYAGAGTKDHLRTAVQLLSDSPPQRTVYEHLGWRKIGEHWFYLHGNGAIGTIGTLPEVEVFLEGKLSAYALVPPMGGADLAQAVQSSLALLSLARADLIYPLLAAIYRAPLAEVLSVDCSLFLAGGTGCQKTELSALAQAHYGAGFHGKHLPGNWVTSENSLEKQAFLVKDALFTVDDFAPSGTSADVQRLHQKADRIFRGQGNKQGRGRMRADGSLRPEFYSRGLVLSSGEDLPGGQSCRARLLVLEMSRGDVNLELLTLAQTTAREGRYAQAMASYVQWLAPQLDELRVSLRTLHEELRQAARRGGAVHDRVPDNVVGLALGLYHFLRFAAEVGVITSAELDEHWARGWQALLSQGDQQGMHVQQEEPTSRFISLLSACLAAGHAHVADPEQGRTPEFPQRWGWQLRSFGAGEHWREEWLPQGKCLGWMERSDLYLEPDETYAAVQRLAHAQGGRISVSQQTLWKRLGEKGLLASREEKRGRNTIRRTLAGMRRDVLHLRVETLSGETVPIVPTRPSTVLHALAGANSLGRKRLSPAETVPQNSPSPIQNTHFSGPAGADGTIGTLSTDKGSCSVAVPRQHPESDYSSTAREVIEL